MKVKPVLIGAFLFALGTALGVTASTYFFQNFTIEALNARFLGDLSQDVAMVNSLNAAMDEASMRLSKIRLEGTLVGLKAQWPYLSEEVRAHAIRVALKAKGKDQELDKAIELLQAPP